MLFGVWFPARRTFAGRHHRLGDTSASPSELATGTMVKAALTTHAVPADEIAQLCARFGYGDGTAASISATQLFGGFSGITFRIDEQRGARRTAVLKVCLGYPTEEVKAQAVIQAVLGQRGFTSACAALPVAGGAAGGAAEYVVQSSRGQPVCMLTHVPGVPADAAIEEKGADPIAVIRSIGEGLARMHRASPVPGEPPVRTFREGGACLLQLHCSGAMLRALRASEHTTRHPYVDFYERRLGGLRAAVGERGMPPGLPCGICHGDPFLDNVLVDAPSGALCGLIDFEDACAAPLVFDVACCAIGTCFVQAGGGAGAGGGEVLDPARLAALLIAYASERPLRAAERAALLPYLRAALLCNCTWRFKNFHIDHRDALDARDSYLQLQRRIEHLERAEVEALVGAILGSLPGSGEDDGGTVAPAEGGGGLAAVVDRNLPALAVATSVVGVVIGALLRRGARGRN